MSPSFPPPDTDDVNNDAELDPLSRLPHPALLEFAASLFLPTFTAPPSHTRPLTTTYETETKTKHKHGHTTNTTTLFSSREWLATQTTLPETLLPRSHRGEQQQQQHQQQQHQQQRRRRASRDMTKLFRNSGPSPGLCLSVCPAHGALLDAELVGFCLGLAQAEVSVRCDVLRGFVRRFGRGGRCDHFDYFHSSGGGPSSDPSFDGEGQYHEEHPRHREGQQQQLVDRMRDLVNTLNGVATLFLSRSDFERYYGRGINTKHTFQKVESGCAACVLAAVGGRAEVLVALRANIKARAKGRELRLLALVEAWMQIVDPEKEREMKAENDALAEEVREVRRWMHARKVERRRGDIADGTRGRSRHRGGLPAGTRIVGGVPMPQVRIHRRGDYQHYGSYKDSYSVGGLDGAEDFEPSSQKEVRGEDDWSGVPSRASSPFTDGGASPDGEYVPTRNPWYHEDRPNAQIPEPLFRRRQQDDDASVRDPLAQASPLRQIRAGSHNRPSQRSTGTDWGDFWI